MPCQNILIKSQPPENWWVKLADFGISKRAEEGAGASTVKGTLEFMAPELLGFIPSAEDEQSYDNQPADMWALGEVAFRMLTGRHTFQNIRLLGQYCLGAQDYPIETLKEFVNSEGTEFIVNLMRIRPNLRLSASDALHHP